MKILQVAPYFIPYPGGQERYVYNLSKYLVNMGHEVHIVTSNFPEGKIFDKIDDITIEKHRVYARVLRNPIAPGVFFKLRKIIKNYDIVHIHNEHGFSSISTAFLKNKNNFHLVLTTHGQLTFGTYFFDQIAKKYDKSIGKTIYNKADRIITLSHSDANYISSFGIEPKKIKILPNAINPSDFDQYINTNNEAFLKKYNIENKQIVLYVGQIIQRKGIEYLLKSIKYIVKELPEDEIVFLFVGTGDYIKTAEKMVRNLNIQDSVIFTGKVPFNELVQAYNSSDIYVLPSFAEGLPTTILEAMYFGLPVVATDIPGVRDHFNENAILVPTKNDSELGKAIVKLLKDKELAHNLSLEGIKLVKNKYLWKKVAKDYEKLYEEIHLKGEM